MLRSARFVVPPRGFSPELAITLEYVLRYCSRSSTVSASSISSRYRCKGGESVCKSRVLYFVDCTCISPAVVSALVSPFGIRARRSIGVLAAAAGYVCPPRQAWQIYWVLNTSAAGHRLGCPSVWPALGQQVPFVVDVFCVAGRRSIRR
jgi:hypothetical protein